MTATESPSSAVEEARGTAGSPAAPTPPTRSARGHGLLLLGEAGVAVGVAVVCVLLARTVDVNPLDRVGQVSGLAALGLHHVLLGLLVLALVGTASRFGSEAVARAAPALG